MNLLTTKQNDIFLIEVNIPRTSIYLANEFKELIFDAIDSGEKYFIVDFSKCEFIDSTFLGVLVVSYKRLIPVGGNIHLVIKNQNIVANLEMTRMNKIFQIFPTVEEASKNLLHTNI
ncbi:MAG: STAS domain-containing protein [Ignavibacteria bacterium]